MLLDLVSLMLKGDLVNYLAYLPKLVTVQDNQVATIVFVHAEWDIHNIHVYLLQSSCA